MEWFEALILGLIQGLTEFLPVSSSGHLELGKAILGVDTEFGLMFTVVVHGATVLSTIVVFRNQIWDLIKGLFQFKWNEETRYLAKIAVSMIPVGIVGVFFKDYIEALFASEAMVLIVGIMLFVTAALLAFTHYSKPRDKEISFLDSLIIGIAQTFAVMPGISRSGATIATGLYLGNKKAAAAQFSFLMVLVPILGENLLDLVKGDFTAQGGIGGIPLLVGFLAAFISGLLACTWMIKIVKRGKLIYFSIYCAIVGTIAIIFGLL